FFFQAEDGIRDRNVTGVQTCALPISEAVVNDEILGHVAFSKNLQSLDLEDQKVSDKGLKSLNGLSQLQKLSLAGTEVNGSGLGRSEERRVGKEWRCLGRASE